MFRQSFFLDSACHFSFLKIFFLKDFYDAARLAQKTPSRSARLLRDTFAKEVGGKS
jgi:hypothetical protein